MNSIRKGIASFTGLMAGVTVLLLLIASCQLNPGGTIVPDGATSHSLTGGSPLEDIVSATLYLYVNSYTDSPEVNVHRITGAWEENTVTWSSFASSYDPDIEGSFTISGSGPHSVDITDVLKDWVDGTYENHGLLLEQGQKSYTTYFASEHSTGELRPKVEIIYNSGASSLTIQRLGDSGDIFDAYIWDTHGTNGGQSQVLYTGLIGGAEKQTLIKFDLPFIPQGPCTRTPGYWKNHAGFGPQPDVVSDLLPIWLGEVGETKSIEVSDAAQAVSIFEKENDGSKNGIAKLYSHLLAAKLNIANEADGTVVSDVIDEADLFLTDFDWTDWDTLSKDDRKIVLEWKDMLDEYNNGEIGPGSCD